MKNKLLTLLIALIASVGTLFAESGTCGANLTWDLTGGVLTISGTGAMTDYAYHNPAPWYANRESITSVTIGNSVTSIGNYAFAYCTGLTSVTIPNSVTSIGSNAFAYCSSLTSVEISNSVTSIGDYAFVDCSGLISVAIPNSVTSIGLQAFLRCIGLTSIDVASDNSNYCSVDGVLFNKGKTTLIQYPGGKQGVYTIPNSVTSIRFYAFSGCTGLTTVTIPNSVTSIGSYAFSLCTGLTSVVIPNSVTSIGSGAFYNCSGLTSVTIPNSVTSIGGSAFEGCSGLTSVTIPNSVTSIGHRAFYDCSGLTSPVYNAHVFAYMPTSYSGAYTIPDGIESIAGVAFDGCTGLTSVTIPYSVTSIGDGAFYGCTGLTSVTIGNSVTSIGGSAFFNCTGLTSVTIPNSVTSIGDYAFYNCSGLTAIYVPCGEMERFKQMLNNDSRINDHAPLPYTITTNAEHGNVTYPQTMCDDMSLNATPDYGYHFVQWSDGVTDNPRTIELTRDTTFTAEIAIDKTGNCGDDNALIWTYDAETKTLTITGNGTLNSNYYFGIEAPAQMQKLVIGNEVTSIGDSAFYGMSTINHLIIGGSVATIGNYAFAECRNFDDITCYSTNVPVINATTFANVGNKQYIYLYVPENRERAYQRDEFWGEFDMQINDAETTNIDTNNVTVGASNNTALFTWPITENAATYTLQITKDGELFCTLIFNSLGQLTGIAFAPSRDRSSQMPAAIMSVSAMSFTVTGLDAASKYSYRLSVTDEALNEIQAYSGEFATTGYEGEINEGGEPEIVDTDGIEEVLNQQSEIKNQKLMIDGQLFILRDGKIFNAQGARVK